LDILDGCPTRSSVTPACTLTVFVVFGVYTAVCSPDEAKTNVLVPVHECGEAPSVNINKHLLIALVIKRIQGRREKEKHNCLNQNPRKI